MRRLFNVMGQKLPVSALPVPASRRCQNARHYGLGDADFSFQSNALAGTFFNITRGIGFLIQLRNVVPEPIGHMGETQANAKG